VSINNLLVPYIITTLFRFIHSFLINVDGFISTSIIIVGQLRQQYIKPSLKEG